MAYPSNSGDAVAADKLRGFIGQVEASDERIKSENTHKSDIYKQAKKDGFNVKAMRKVVAARRMDSAARSQLETDFDLYMMHVESLAHAHVENIEQLDAETGEFTDDKPEATPRKIESAKPGAADALDTPLTNTPREASGTAREAPGGKPTAQADIGALQHGPKVAPQNGDTKSAPPEPSGVAAGTGGEGGLTPVLSAEPITDEPEPHISDACRSALKLRPYCLAAQANELTKCGGTGKMHCTDCRKAHADAMGETA